jgi:hypothetical protein
VSKPKHQWTVQPRNPIEMRSERLGTVAEDGLCDAPIGRRMPVSGTAARSAALRRWSELPGFARVIVRHGDAIKDQPLAAAARIADDLAA